MKKVLISLISLLVLTICPAYAASLQGDWVGIESNSTIHIEQSGNILTGTYRWHDKINLPITGSIYQDTITLKVKFDSPEKIQKWYPPIPYAAAVQANGVEALYVSRQLNTDLLSGIWITPMIQLDDEGNVIGLANGGSASTAKNVFPQSAMSFMRKQ